MKLVFCGTPQFAVPTLEAVLAAGHDVALVLTQPDRAAGRGMELQTSPVKKTALEHNIPITQPEKIKNNLELRQQLEDIRPDAIIVVAYGRIIPQWMLDLPPHGNINLHGSLLPKYRGAAPIQWAVASGEVITGVTTMRLDAGLDTGGILLLQELAIAPDDTAETLSPRLALIGADLVVETLRRLQTGSVQSRPQDNSQASLAPILKKEDGLVDFSRSAIEIFNRIRGFQPWPGAYTKFRGKTLQILKARPATASVPHAELNADFDHLLVGCGHNTSLELLEIQLEGKKRTSAGDFIRGYRPHQGEKLG